MNDLPFYLHFALALLIAPFLSGIINRVKAKVAGRHGKPLLQLYFDIFKGLRKGEVLSHLASPVFTLGPMVGLASVLCALALLPLGGQPSPYAFTGDFLLVAYLLGLGRFLTVLAALDTGSSFEGMGASREASFGALAEPVLFLVFLGLISASSRGFDINALSLSDMLYWGGKNLAHFGSTAPELWLIPIVFFALLLVENCRIPIDDPTTHLELTMIHEVMVLDHSGPSLAIIEYAASLKLWFFAALTIGILMPQNLNVWQQGALWIGSVMLVSVIVGLVESVVARLQMRYVPRFLGVAAALAALILAMSEVQP